MRRYGGWLWVLGILLIPIIGHAGEGGKPLWVSEDDEAQLYQGDLPLHVILSHATDCRANVTNARAEQLCRDLDDGQVWRCIDPTAVGSPDFCDNTSEWAGGLPLFLESDGTLNYALDSGTQKVQICNTAKTLCHRWAISDSDGPIYDGVCAGGDCDTTIAVKSAKDLTITYGTTDVLQMLAGTNDFKATSSGWISPRSGTASPSAGDCDAAPEAGRVYIETDLTADSIVHVCNGTAWQRQGKRTVTKSITVLSPTTTETGKIQWYWPQAVTLGRVACSTDTGTATIQLEERAEATPNTTGTSSLTASLVCDTTSELTTSFSDATIAADVPHVLIISAVASAPTVVRVHIRATLN